ncbi:HEAT repeat domain-containing protein [Rapidithrix thailandica]|uniref:HEAT repeat domain-containing protein n=1 Tax=Rapidithrix thailandica TaxID=413964 RepID=A0AAW9SBN8_9BACT
MNLTPSKPIVNLSLWLSGVLFAGVIYFTQACQPEKKESPAKEQEARLIQNIEDPQYVGNLSCKSCHEQEYMDWQNSHHDLAMQEANEQTVLGDFNNATFENQGVKTTFIQKEGKYYVNTEGPEGKNETYEVVYTFGVTPLQQYLVAFPDGRYQCLRQAWDVEKKQWFDLYPDTKVSHKEWLHWSRGGLNWNSMCADCHSTNLHKSFDSQKEEYETQWSAMNVSCEACHGPGKKHVEAVGAGEYDAAHAHLYLTKNISSQEQVDQCARCHSRRGQITTHFEHSESFMDQYIPSILTPDLYYPDGQIEQEDYVYGSFLQSKMYHNNVRCTDCHNPHTLQLKALGNNLCMQCHEPKKYNTEKHHFHAKDTEASQCVNCHMTGKVYMGNDFRRDHSFRVPRPDQSVKFGTPNACNQCHTDKDARWAANQVEQWYGKHRAPHFSDVLTEASEDPEKVLQALKKLVANPQQPAIARATATWYLQQVPDTEALQGIAGALSDNAPIVRYTATDALGALPVEERLPLLAPLLKDPVRAVRIAAVRSLGDVPKAQFPDTLQSAYTRAMAEYSHLLKANSDFPSGQVALGVYYSNLGEHALAEKAYKRALELDHLQNPARINLATMYNGQGRNQEAIALLRTVIAQEAEYGPAYYSLGLLLAETGKLAEAEQNLQLAAEKVGNNPRIFYNWGLALQQLNRPEEAEKAYLKGLDLTPESGDLHYALCVLYIQQKQFANARKHAQILLDTYPDAQELQQLMQTIEQGL